jgi:hypothetical protein
MSHAYPLAVSVDDALAADAPAARTRADAEALAAGRMVEALVTDWRVMDEAAIAALLTRPTAASGHLQRYEDAGGAPVLAITWWRLCAPGAAKARSRKRGAATAPPHTVSQTSPETPAETPREDHTDDLYFREGRTLPRRGKAIDPNQRDLFSSED